MNYQTQLMKQILTNSKAQEIIDYVSQLYGNSYVGLWLFQTIGSTLGPICDAAEQLKLETSPYTTTRLIIFYEQEYGIQSDPTMTLQQRRNRVIAAMRSKGAITPARLADAVSAALGGAPVEVIEYDGYAMNFYEIDQIVLQGYRYGPSPDPNAAITVAEIDDIVIKGDRSGQQPDPETSITDEEIDAIVIYGVRQNPDDCLNKNHFIVSVRQAVNSLLPAQATIERLKPAHLSYTLRGVTQTTGTANIKVGTALTTAEIYHVEVQQ